MNWYGYIPVKLYEQKQTGFDPCAPDFYYESNFLMFWDHTPNFENALGANASGSHIFKSGFL
jgi:hypothetical protein